MIWELEKMQRLHTMQRQKQRKVIIPSKNQQNYQQLINTTGHDNKRNSTTRNTLGLTGINDKK